MRVILDVPLVVGFILALVVVILAANSLVRGPIDGPAWSPLVIGLILLVLMIGVKVGAKDKDVKESERRAIRDISLIGAGLLVGFAYHGFFVGSDTAWSSALVAALILFFQVVTTNR